MSTEKRTLNSKRPLSKRPLIRAAFFLLRLDARLTGARLTITEGER